VQERGRTEKGRVRGVTRREALRAAGSAWASLVGAGWGVGGLAAWGQGSSEQGTALEFDVTSVKPSAPGGRWSSGIDTMPGRILGERVTLKRCIMQAYSVGPHQVIGGPDWMAIDRWRIEARASSPVDDDAVLMKMLQALLANRFGLVVRRETHRLPAYVLEVGRNGPKMERSDGVENDADTDGWRGAQTLTAKKTDMNTLADVLGARLDRPVVNRTGLAGGYNFTLHWSPANGGVEDDDDAEDMSVFTAVVEQLGLRLRAAKADVRVLVVDRAERPSAN